MAGVASIIQGKVINKSGEEVDLTNGSYSGKVFGLYFSAHWCPPCRFFTPMLADFYKKYAKQKNFEIIFISSDSDEAAFKEYYHTMPWLALDFSERNAKQEVSRNYEVSGIPTLVLVDGDTGETICTDARDHIQGDDPDGSGFPWAS